MNCGICLEMYDSSKLQPMVIDCGHSFCKQCIILMFEKQRLECPYDRKPILKTLSEIKVNYLAQEIIMTLKKRGISLDNKAESASIIQKNCIEVTNNEETKLVTLDYFPTQIKKGKCYNKHPLIEINIPEALGDTKCKYCDNKTTPLSWTCKICNLIICQLCYSDQIQLTTRPAFPSIFCPLQHELLYYENTIGLYHRKGGPLSIIQCDNCKATWRGGSWSCRICAYDLCLACKNKNEISGDPICLKNHLLVYRSDVSDFYRSIGMPYWQCTLCKAKFTDASYHCRPCQYDLCTDCKKIMCNQKILKQKCPNGHSMDYVTAVKVNNMFKIESCNGCNEVFSAMKYFKCYLCNYDLCGKCIVNTELVIQFGVKSQCKENHRFTWCGNYNKIYIGSEYTCRLCQRSFYSAGSFRCDDCDFDICISCASLCRSG